MKTNALISQDWDDLVFEDRNKEYGAFALRKSYSSRVMTGTVGGITLVVLAFALPGIVNSLFGENELFIPKPELPPLKFSEVNIVPNERRQVKAEPKIKIPKPNTYVPVKSEAADPIDPPAVPQENAGSTNGTIEGTPAPESGLGTESGVSNVGAAVVEAKEETPLTWVKEMPEYNGGLREMMRFIKSHVKYPSSAKAIGQEGKVFVQFVIAKDGSVTDVHVITGVSHALDQEAARVIALMPKWKPGRQNDHNVAVRMVMPVWFTFEN